MKKVTGGLVAVLLVLTCFLAQAWAEEVMPQTGQAADPWAQAQALIDKGGVDNCKQALDMCLSLVQKEPGSFQANWMAAQACREYGLAVKKSEKKGWEGVCKEYGKKGMAFAEKAIAMDPAKAQGYYWYGMSVGIYSDGVSILTALKEGLKDKTQNNLETAYKIDKAYDKYGSVAALGRFWQVLPWPLNDTDKSIEYYREFQKTKSYDDPDTVEVKIYLAEILKESGKTKEEAKDLLTQSVKITDASGDRYWNKRAKELLADL